MSKIRLRTAVAAGVLAAASLTTAVAAPAGAVQTGKTEGCTPGYWKNHPQSWLENPGDKKPAYTPSTPLSTVSSAFDAHLPGATFGSALQGGGGSGVKGANVILARAATASWLNATVEIKFPYRRVELKKLVTGAVSSEDRAQMIDLAKTLDDANNLGCPLS